MPTIQGRSLPGVFEAVAPFVGDSELWCHRTQVNDPSTFWSGLRIPLIQAGLRSTATRLTDTVDFPSMKEAIDEFSTRWIEDEPMDNARVFVVTPLEHGDILVPYDTGRTTDQKGLLPGRFVLAHVSLVDEAIAMNPDFQS